MAVSNSDRRPVPRSAAGRPRDLSRDRQPPTGPVEAGRPPGSPADYPNSRATEAARPPGTACCSPHDHVLIVHDDNAVERDIVYGADQRQLKLECLFGLFAVSNIAEEPYAPQMTSQRATRPAFVPQAGGIAFQGPAADRFNSIWQWSIASGSAFASYSRFRNAPGSFTL